MAVICSTKSSAASCKVYQYSLPVPKLVLPLRPPSWLSAPLANDENERPGYLYLQTYQANKNELSKGFHQTLLLSEVNDLNGRVRGLSTTLPSRSLAGDDNCAVIRFFV